MTTSSVTLRASRIVAAVALPWCVPSAARAGEAPPTPAAWVARSNANAMIVGQTLARFEPETAHDFGVMTGFDDQVRDLHPDVESRYRTELASTIRTLKERLETERDVHVREDLEILIAAAERRPRESEAREKTELPYYEVTRIIFNGIDTLLGATQLEDTSPLLETRRQMALIRLSRYAGMEKEGSVPLASSAEQRTREYFHKTGLAAPYKARVERDLATDDELFDGVVELLKQRGVQGSDSIITKLREQLSRYDAFVRAEVLPLARTDFRMPRERYLAALEATGVDVCPEELVALAHAGFERTQSEIKPVAREVAVQRGLPPDTDWRDLIRLLKQKEALNGPAETLDQYHARAQEIDAILRRENLVGGAPFSLGFLVGSSSTPNRLAADPKPDELWDADDANMPEKVRILERCPFCRGATIQMGFDRRRWTLEHRCTNDACPWPEDALPFYVVDEEIYRFLPTVLVGTLDKAASISMQAAMRGLVGAPLGLCSKEGHGFTYAKRQKRPQGCLVPGCSHALAPLPMAPELFAPSFRLQDELHLLKDSLGAVDAHYESLYDGLQQELSGRRAKILASSATLSGYERQSEVLYQREARVFPQQGPAIGQGFWTRDSQEMMRRFVAIAPKGVTIEYTVDRLLTVLQVAIRRLITEPETVCQEAGIELEHVPDLLSLYGTNVVYGNTLRDLDAVMRSTETQVQVSGNLNVDSLTGRTDFEQIRLITARLENPEADFQDRLHVVPASSMMSHGVDINRLNVMVIVATHPVLALNLPIVWAIVRATG